MEDRQRPGPSSISMRSDGVHLLGLPDNCLYRIVKFMDPKTREQFFRVSKGSADKPGCAVLLLRACKPRFNSGLFWGIQPKRAPSTMLHWAAQLSTDMHLEMYCSGQGPTAVLESLLLFPQESTTSSSQALGPPATYPGVISIVFTKPQWIIPDLVIKAFPNLKQLEGWHGQREPFRPMFKQELSGIQHLGIPFDDTMTMQHVAQQLANLPAVTSMRVDRACVLAATHASALGRLTHLEMSSYVQEHLPSEDRAGLKKCTGLYSLKLHVSGTLPILSQLVPHLRELEFDRGLTDAVLPRLLALPNLTSLTAHVMSSLSADYSSAPCKWRRLRFTESGYSDIIKLPLHTLDSPVECQVLHLHTTASHAVDMAAIKAAQPHLIRCGGIMMRDGRFTVDTRNNPSLTKQQADELLEAWAPCLSPAPINVRACDETKPLIAESVARLWPAAQFVEL